MHGGHFTANFRIDCNKKTNRPTTRQLKKYSSIKTNKKKSIKLIILLLLTSHMLSAQNNFYYYQGETIPLKIVTDKILVKFEKEISLESKRNVISISSKVKPILEKHTHRNNIVIPVLAENTNENELRQIITELNKNKEIEYANPYYAYFDSIVIGLTNQFIVKLKVTTTYTELEELVNSTKTTIGRQDKYDKNIYIISTNKSSTGNALEIANYFYETRKFEFSEPSFLKTAKLYTNDTFYPQQWALENTGQNGGAADADMDVNEAWTITTGRDVVRVAVIDEGTDLNHPDLVNNLLPGFDASGTGTNGGPIGGTAPHGTATAGIIGAEASNGIGISGVAYNCSLIPVSLDLTGAGFSDIEAADAINWAWDDGQADVLSNSWGGIPQSSFIDIAISNAVTMGRGGLGSVVLFSTGNDADDPNNTSVKYPAKNPNVIAVGATTKNDAKTSYSNYGSELDVVAPGGNSDIYTTDISGSAGYDAGDYTSGFGGTSAACPNAAGVVALIFSVNRCLTQQDARRILELSCDKVGGYCYNPGQPNGLWNNQMGYGRVNAYKAVQYAFSLQTNLFFNTSGSDQGAGSNFTWILASGGCSQLAAATYVAKIHEIRATVSYPNTQAPILIGSANGFSGANPNGGSYFMDVMSVSSTSATVRTWVYEIVSTISGQPLSWVPTDPSNIRFNFTVLSSLSADLYFQNQTVTGTETHNAINKIEAGRNVTGAVSVGDYVVQSGANITFHAGNEIILSDGFVAEAGSNFHAFVDPFFTCTQYPMGKMANPDNNNNFPPVIQEYESTKLKDTIKADQKSVLISNFPNPFSSSTTIEYQIKKSNSVTITVYDYCGRQLLLLKNKSPHEAGTYQVKMDGISLPSGVYHCTLQTDDYVETKQMIKTE